VSGRYGRGLLGRVLYRVWVTNAAQRLHLESITAPNL